MKTLSIFRTADGITVERKNQFGTTFKKVFETEEGMLEYLSTYKTTGAIDEYEMKVSEEFWTLVINSLASKNY